MLKSVASLSLAAGLGLAVFVTCGQNPGGRLASQLPAFEKRLETMRQNLQIPAMSVAIALDTEIVWSRGMGLADVANYEEATDTTSYLLASLTKTFASTILMQLVEQGKVNLDDPVSKYGVNLDQARQWEMISASDDSITVRHLFSHTAHGIPGTEYNYNGYLFSFLDSVIASASGRSFGELVVEQIITPLGLRHTAPNIIDSVNFSLAGADWEAFCANLARPYAFDSLGEVVESNYETYFGVAAGLVTSAVDMARYSIAIDQGRFLKEETQRMAYSPTISNDGDTLPYGLGWFCSHYKGTEILWHYGLWNTNSSLIIKVPEKQLTLVALANSNTLTLSTSLGGDDGNLLTSQLVTDFLETFVFPQEKLPYVDYTLPLEELTNKLARYKESEHRPWLVKQLFAFAGFFNAAGQSEQARKLMHVYNAVYTKPLPEWFEKLQALVRIDSVENNADRSVDFSLPEETALRVFAIGEGLRLMANYGWIEDASSSEIVWEMVMEKTSDAGGSTKNRLADAKIVLPAGDYRLRYKSDESHAFMDWNAEPPDYPFYGIAVCLAD